MIRLVAERDIENTPEVIGRVIDAGGRWMDHTSARDIPHPTATQHLLTL